MSIGQRLRDAVPAAVDQIARGIAIVKANATLLGVPANSNNLGTFLGDIIRDNPTVKQALQDLESSISSVLYDDKAWVNDELIDDGNWSTTLTSANDDGAWL